MAIIAILEGSKISYFRVFVFLGGIMTVVFGLLSAFVRGLAFGTVYVDPTHMASVYFSHFYFQTHDFTIGMLVSSVGGLLGLISSVKHFNKLISIGYIGGIMGVLGFLLTQSGFFHSLSTGEYRFNIPWVGACLTLMSFSLMLTGLAANSGGWRYLMPLGALSLLISYCTLPLSILFNNNLTLFHSIHREGGALLTLSNLAGYSITLLGSAIGAWKFHTDLLQILSINKR